MATVSRLVLAHPALGTTGGPSLHAAVEALYQKIGDAISSRWYQLADFDNGESVDVAHNFDADISTLRWDLYVFTGGQWVRVTTTSSPARSAFTVVEKVGDEDNQLTITNVSAGNDLLVALVLVNDPLALNEGDITDVDVSTTPPEDGQALVYDSVSGKFKPGASGDASFKIQGVTDPNAVIKGGYIILDDGRELATYDGTGSASTDYGKDQTVSLDTILGGNPANGTTYALCIDLESLSAAVTLTDTGRKVLGVVEANYRLFTTMPDALNRARYLFVGFVRSATSGTVWSGSGAAFGTFATRRHANAPVAVSPVVYHPSQVLGSVGAAGQIAGGHLISSKSFPPTITGGQRRWWSLATDATTDGSGNSETLTAVNTPTFPASSGLFGDTGMTLNGTSQYTGKNAASVNPFASAIQDFTFACWAKNTNWATAQSQVIGEVQSASGTVFEIQVGTTGTIRFGYRTGSSSASLEFPHGLTGTVWAHIAIRFDSTANIYYFYINGVLVGTSEVVTTPTTVTAEFRLGARVSPLERFWSGSLREAVLVTGFSLMDGDIRKLASTRIDHAKDVAAANQDWSIRSTGDNGNMVQHAGAVVSQSDRNSLFVDLSGISATATVDLVLSDLGLSATQAQAGKPFDQTYSSTPTFPIAHGLGDVPVLMAMQEVAAGLWQPVSLQGILKVDGTNIQEANTGDFATAFTLSGSARLRLIAFLGNGVPSSILDANASRGGALSAGEQSIPGLKKFLGGAANIGNVRASEGTSQVLTDSDKRRQVFSPSANINCDLPSTGIKKGDTWTLDNLSTTFDVTIRSSAGTNIERIRLGTITLVALQDAPTADTHWRVAHVYEEIGFIATFNGMNATVQTNGKCVRNNKAVTVYIPNATGTSNTTAFSISGIPLSCRPATNQRLGVVIVIDSGTETIAWVVVSTAGNLVFTKANSITSWGANSFTNTGTKGLATDNVSYHYSLN